jgi:D-lyxose ketol-isomerase
MKRSEINKSIEDAIAFFRENNFSLPHFAYWKAEEWNNTGPEYDEIRKLGLGWDVTDFGSGNLIEVGRTIFTLRNGRHNDNNYPKPYAQKAMYMPAGQKSIIHYHKSKREDICNQAGGNVMIRLWKADDNNEFSEESFKASLSGVEIDVTAGEAIRIKPGESLTVTPFTYHQFWAEVDHGPTLTVEVSSVCDDHTDNYFYESFGCRFPEIEEDEEKKYLLCQEY